jgi:hypothetical protein
VKRRVDQGGDYLPQHLKRFVSTEAAKEAKTAYTPNHLRNADPNITFWHWLHYAIDANENADVVDMLLRYM